MQHQSMLTIVSYVVLFNKWYRPHHGQHRGKTNGEIRGRRVLSFSRCPCALYRAPTPDDTSVGPMTSDNFLGEQGYALTGPVVEHAYGRRARRAGGRDGGGGGRTISPRAQHARGGPEVYPDTAGRWLHCLCDPPQCARWRHQRRDTGLGRVRNCLGRPPWRGVLRAPESQGAHGGGSVSSGPPP